MNLLDDGLGGGISAQLLGLILVVHIVSDADKLAIIVGAGQKNDSNANDLGIGDALSVGGIGLEDELVYSNGNGSNKQGVELLVMLVALGKECQSITTNVESQTRRVARGLGLTR